MWNEWLGPTRKERSGRRITRTRKVEARWTSLAEGSVTNSPAQLACAVRVEQASVDDLEPQGRGLTGGERPQHDAPVVGLEEHLAGLRAADGDGERDDTVARGGRPRGELRSNGRRRPVERRVGDGHDPTDAFDAPDEMRGARGVEPPPGVRRKRRRPTTAAPHSTARRRDPRRRRPAAPEAPPENHVTAARPSAPSATSGRGGGHPSSPRPSSGTYASANARGADHAPPAARSTDAETVEGR